MSNSVQPHRWQPTRLPHPWDSPGKNTGVGCHFLLQCMNVKSESEVAQSCPTLRDPMDCSLPGSSVHGIFQARVLQWGAIAFSNPHYYSTTILGSAHLLGEFFIICLPTSGCFTTCAPPFLHQKQRIILVLDFDFISLNPGSVISKLCDQQQVAFPIKKI